MKICWRIISLFLVIATLVTTLPLTVFAEEIRNEIESKEVTEFYIKEVKLVQAKSEDEAKHILSQSGYALMKGNLNEGTGEDGIWMGYLTTTDPTEAIYDFKIMNMKGGFTRSSMEEALAAQGTAIAGMVEDLELLMNEFIDAYEEGSEAAKSAYTALNFFRVIEGETELLEENGLGYQIVNGGVSTSILSEILLFCDPTFVDCIVKLLTMGIQTSNGNWLARLSEVGPYDEDTEYMDDEEKLNYRAKQLLNVLQLYSEVYNTMVKSGLMPDELDENFNPVYKSEDGTLLTATEADIQRFGEGNYKFYKLAEMELAKYTYGDGKTLKDLFVSLANEDDERVLYPLVSVLTDGEFSALSYGCFLEMVTGADSTDEDFSSYDELYATLTEEMNSVYLYLGVDKALFEDEAIVGFTDTAQRHIAATGEGNFFEHQNTDERVWEDAMRVVKCIGAAAMAIMGLTKITVGILIGVVGATATKSVAMAATIKYGAMIGGIQGLIVAVVVVALAVLFSYLHAIWISAGEEEIDWEKNPMLQYMYDVQEVSFMQASDDGIGTEFMRRPAYILYEAVTDLDGGLVDLNARSATQWIQLFVSYDRQGADAKPIVCDTETDILRIRTGDGQTPEGYSPVTRFGEVIAYDLNQWDHEDTVNGVYLFFKQDQDVAVDSGVKYYISEVQLQTGESPAHCINLLKDAGYTPINVNLSPDLTDGDFMFEDKIYTYIGYRTTTSEASAIRDIRLVYGSSQGAIQYGAAGYADCGSNGVVTLYATKYAAAGTPLLAGGLICVDEPAKAPLGYEPVCLMSGGPAVPVNVNNDGEAREDNGFMYLYFLPETTFTSGKLYIGGLATFQSADDLYDSFQVSNAPAIEDLWGGYVPAVGAHTGTYTSAIYYYPTYNPYRAIYSIKAAELFDDEQTLSNALTVEGTPYYKWNVIRWGYDWHKDSVDKENKSIEKDLVVTIRTTELGKYSNQAFYLAGNTDSKNVYNAEKGEMSKVQPIEISDVLFYNASGKITVPEGFYPVINAFGNDIDIPMEYLYCVIYTKAKNEEKPYVSGISAIDQLTLYRLYGGAEKGVSLDQITSSAMYSYLLGQGATEVRSFSPMMFKIVIGMMIGMNETQFALTRTAKSNQALTDVVFYFNEFSTDEPPKELYRGSVKYTLLCEVPYNLLGNEDAPSAGVYLYGTTSSKAGNKITDIQISTTPFLEGYEAVRTINGGTLMSEIFEYVKHQKDHHPMDKGREFFEALYKFFDNDDHEEQLQYYYLNIRREGDEKHDNDRLYIEKLYLTSTAASKAVAMDQLFAQGADGFVDLNLNAYAGGDVICVGYSYTADPEKAIKDIRAYHKKNPPKTLTDDDGRVFELVSDLDLNKGAGGDYIYLYTSKGLESDDYIVEIFADYKIVTGGAYKKWGTSELLLSTYCTKRWDSSKNSDLNKGAGGEYVYLMYRTVWVTTDGVDEEVSLDYGKDKTYTRNEFKNQDPNGQYIGGIYVMDKETIRLEKIESGALSSSSKCSDITDKEVFDRLTAMGATTIIETPILVNSGEYFEGNTNKVFIGYSRTSKSSSAIRNLAIKAEIMSMDEPKDKIEVGGKSYTLVAEAAKKVTELPKAINLIGIENGESLNLPRLYLYYSTSTGSDPIYDLSIDSLPLVSGYNTVRSANQIDTFTDIYQQACDLRDITEADETFSKYDLGLYKEELVEWMSEMAELFNPEDADLKSFYIHVKRHGAQSLEEVKPYIGKLFIAAGSTKHEALTQLLAYEPDGFIDVDLNEDAGGDYVYLAYKRIEKSRDALTDIMVYEGKKFEPSRRITIDGENVKYTLVEDIDLNKDAGGKYLYLYATDSSKIGTPIMSLDIKDKIDSYLKCGVERVTVKRAENEQYADEYIDLNKDAGGDYLYMVMTRETTEGHTSNGIVTEEIITEATCTEDGCRIEVSSCADCGVKMEIVAEVLEAHGNHVDDEEDGDHKCDACGKRNVTEHNFCGYVEPDPDDSTKSIFIQRCSDCGEPNGVQYPITESNTYKFDTGAASLLGDGSVIVLCTLAGVAILAALIIYLKKRKTVDSNKGDQVE